MKKLLLLSTLALLAFTIPATITNVKANSKSIVIYGEAPCWKWRPSATTIYTEGRIDITVILTDTNSKFKCTERSKFVLKVSPRTKAGKYDVYVNGQYWLKYHVKK